MNIPEITQIAYTAGLFDGEGSISVSIYDRGYKNGSQTLTCNITSTDPDIIPMLKTWWDISGSVYYHERVAHDNMSTFWAWQIRTREAKFILQHIYPYLNIKKARAELAILYIDWKSVIPNNGAAGKNDFDMEIERDVWSTMRYLNSKPVPVQHNHFPIFQTLREQLVELQRKTSVTSI